ncbi:hypothetical protein D3C72_1080200 [compost metagenome]
MILLRLMLYRWTERSAYSIHRQHQRLSIAAQVCRYPSTAAHSHHLRMNLLLPQDFSRYAERSLCKFRRIQFQFVLDQYFRQPRILQNPKEKTHNSSLFVSHTFLHILHCWLQRRSRQFPHPRSVWNIPLSNCCCPLTSQSCRTWRKQPPSSASLR